MSRTHTHRYDKTNPQLASDLLELQSSLAPLDAASARARGESRFRAGDSEGALEAFSLLLQILQCSPVTAPVQPPSPTPPHTTTPTSQQTDEQSEASVDANSTAPDSSADRVRGEEVEESDESCALRQRQAEQQGAQQVAAALSNCAACHMALQRYAQAIADCSRAVAVLMSPACISNPSSPSPTDESRASWDDVDPVANEEDEESQDLDSREGVVGESRTLQTAVLGWLSWLRLQATQQQRKQPVVAEDNLYEQPEAPSSSAQDQHDEQPDEQQKQLQQQQPTPTPAAEDPPSWRTTTAALMRVLGRRGAAHGYLKRYSRAADDYGLARQLAGALGEEGRVAAFRADEEKMRALQAEAARV